MAIINKTGITNGGTIQAEHVTRVIDALSSVSTDSIVATGSFSGSFRGILTGTSSFATSASYAPGTAGIFTFITGSTYTNADSSNNIDLIITGSITTYTQAGNKGFQRFTNAVNTLGVWGDIISANTAGVVGSYSVVQMNDGAVWQSVDQTTYDDVTQPLLGIALDKKSSGNVLLNGYITAYTSGSLSGSGMQFINATSPRPGFAVWIYEGSNSGSISVDKPTGAGAVINIGHVIASGSTVATAGNRLVRVNPRYITSI
jgi:hypothetical protein